MEFSDFFSIIHPIIGGGNSTDKSAKSLFESIMDDNSYEILDGYSSATFKAYANGSTKITKIAKAISPYIDASEFEDYIDNFGEAATIRLSESFLPHVPDITRKNVGEKLADLFIEIIETAANSKRKSPSKKKKEDNKTPNIDHPNIEKLVLETLMHTPKEERGEALEEIIAYKRKNTSDEGASANDTKKNINEEVLDIESLSQEDKDTLKSFRSDCEETLLYIIDNDPSAGSTKMELSEEISFIIQRWQLRYRKIESSSLRTLVTSILKVLGEYSYYISDIFLRPIPERGILWFRNESLEEGNRLREELQPNSYKLRCEIGELYQKLYPVPEDNESASTEHIEAEVVDGGKSSGAAESKTTIIQQQTNVVQNGENNFNLTNNGTMNFNL